MLPGGDALGVVQVVHGLPVNPVGGIVRAVDKSGLGGGCRLNRVRGLLDISLVVQVGQTIYAK